MRALAKEAVVDDRDVEHRQRRAGLTHRRWRGQTRWSGVRTLILARLSLDSSGVTWVAVAPEGTDQRTGRAARGPISEGRDGPAATISSRQATKEACRGRATIP